MKRISKIIDTNLYIKRIGRPKTRWISYVEKLGTEGTGSLKTNYKALSTSAADDDDDERKFLIVIKELCYHYNFSSS